MNQKSGQKNPKIDRSLIRQQALSHMLEAAQALCKHMSQKSLSDLEKDRLLLGGVIRELLLIGEAANAVSAQSKAKMTGIPWREVIGMRNQLIHSYFEISYRIIWTTVTEDIPKLISELEKTLTQK